MEVQESREESHLTQFCEIMNNMHEGIIIKTAKDNKILFANKTASIILDSPSKKHKTETV